MRAMAWSAHRAGYRPLAADCFADRDLVECCSTARVNRYPADFVEVVDRFPAGPWMYTGGLENHPDVVQEISWQRELYGNNADVLNRVRDPQQVAAVLNSVGLQSPPISWSNEGLPFDGSWLRKSIRSAGGLRIGAYYGEMETDDRFYFQKKVAGLSCSILYVGTRDATYLVGATEQLVGTGWTGASSFGYAGSIGPLRVEPEIQTEFHRIGDTLRHAFGMLGLFGVDVILDGSELWVLEVNPRYTASVEVLERAMGIHTIQPHVAACSGKSVSVKPLNRTTLQFGKAIYFANEPTIVSPCFSDWIARQQQRSDGWPLIADIPAEGTRIAAGQPVMTVFASAPTADQVRQRLSQRIAAARQMLEK